jgi:hypothetical protein
LLTDAIDNNNFNNTYSSNNNNNNNDENQIKSRTNVSAQSTNRRLTMNVKTNIINKNLYVDDKKSSI